MTRTRDAKVTRPVAQLARLDLNLLVILREPIRERNVTLVRRGAHRRLRQNLQMLTAEV